MDRSLAAILTMNTIAHTVGAIEAGAQASVLFGSSWVGFFSALMTLLILFLSEIIPKTLGALYWPSLVPAASLYIRSLIFLLYPLVRASEGLTRWISRNKDIHQFSREEFLAMAGIGEQIGEIDSQESKIIHNLFRFRSLKVTDIMTPRTVVYAYDQELSIAEAQQLASDSHFSRILLYKGSKDDIVGFALKDEILMHSLERPTKPNLKLFKRHIEAVPDSMQLPKLLELLLQTRQQIVIVVDEYGVLKGLVTLEDVIETLLGMEIIDEMDSVSDMQALARQQWARRAKSLGLQLTEENAVHCPTLAEALAAHNSSDDDIDSTTEGSAAEVQNAQASKAEEIEAAQDNSEQKSSREKKPEQQNAQNTDYTTDHDSDDPASHAVADAASEGTPA